MSHACVGMTLNPYYGHMATQAWPWHPLITVSAAETNKQLRLPRHGDLAKPMYGSVPERKPLSPLEIRNPDSIFDNLVMLRRWKPAGRPNGSPFAWLGGTGCLPARVIWSWLGGTGCLPARVMGNTIDGNRHEATLASPC